MKKNKIKTLFKKNFVFIASLVITVIALVISIFAQDVFVSKCDSLVLFINEKFGWFYLLGVFIIVVVILFLFFSKYGDMKLGEDESTPEFSTFSWIAMLFAAGMGVGLVFWGCTEPLSLYLDAPFGIKSATPEALKFAIKVSFFHWGIHPWCIYSLLGIIIAYVQFRKKEKGLISRVFIPVFGRKLIKGWLGKTIDITAVVATITGLITSLGLGTLQISSGLNYLYGFTVNNNLYFFIILIITVTYISSSVFGLEKGVKNLSNFNLALAIILLLVVIIIAPTVGVFNAMTDGIGNYISSFATMSLGMNTFGKNEWTGKWTVFMWATWIAWAPLVSTFIARVSKGRTIKEFIMAVVLIPTFIGIVWFSAFGVLSINVAHLLGDEAVTTPSLTLFMVLKHYPFGAAISLAAIVLLTTFFITSADSAVFVLGILTSDGNLNPKAPKKIIWGVTVSFLAFCIISAGGLELVKDIAVIGAFPFLIFLLISIFALLRHFHLDRKTVKTRRIDKILYHEKNISEIDNI